MSDTTTNRRFAPTLRRPLHVLFLAVEPVQALDLFGPFEVFHGANRAYRDAPPYRLELVSWHSRTVRGESGPSVRADRLAPRLPPRVDTLVVVGGEGAYRARDPRLYAWIQQASRQARRTVSICTGAFLLARAGLLDGRAATTHWMHLRELESEFPRVTVEPDRLWVEDGPIFASAGVTAGIDLALALVSQDLGARIALTIARALVVYLQRPAGQPQLSVALRGQSSEHQPIRELQAWILEHPSERHTTRSLAARVAMSPRNFTRVFSREVGEPPARYVTGVRVEAARRQLERSDEPLEAIAAHVGFRGADVMTRAFHRQLGITPAAYRERHTRKLARARLAKARAAGDARSG